MMPAYELQTLHYQTKQKDFATYLTILGYSKSSAYNLPVYVKEFLCRLEQLHIYHFKDLSPATINEHYEYLQERPSKTKQGALSSATVSTHLCAIHLFLNWQEQTGSIKTNPISGLSFPTAQHKPREILSQSEIKQLYGAAENLQDKVLLHLFYGCGLRRSEAIKLNTSDIQFKRGILIVREGKGKKRREVPMSKTITEDLENYYLNHRKEDSLQQAFILNRRGKRMTQDSYGARVRKLLKKAGINKSICLHSLRHSIATHLLENGLSLEYVRNFLGHKHLDTTQGYTRINKKQLLNL